MKTHKILIGTLIGGVVMFFLGWLVYGILLSGYMSESCNSCNARPMEEMIWWALIVEHFIFGLLISLGIVFTNNLGFFKGAKVGAVLGLLFGLGFDLGMYSMTTTFNDCKAVMIDVIVTTALFAITGAITGWVLGMKKKTATV